MHVNEQTHTCEVAQTALKDAFPFRKGDEAAQLCSYLELQDWPANEVIMRDGEPGDFMAFLVKGKLAVKKETSFPGKYILVALLESGSMVGEVAVIDDSLRNATVVAIDNSQLLILTREKMDLLLERNPQLGIKLLKRIIHVQGSRLQKASDRLSRLL